MKQIFYISNDIERANIWDFKTDYSSLGYDISKIAIDHSPYFDFVAEQLGDTHTFSLEKVLNSKNIEFRNSAKLLENDLALDYIKSVMAQSDEPNADTYVQTFKISPQFEILCGKLGFKVINSSSKLNRYFEDKFNLGEVCLKSGCLNEFVKLPENVVQNIQVALPESFAKFDFYAQLPRGHTGDGTFYIQDAAAYAQLKDKFPESDFKFSQKVTGISLNINGISTRAGTYVFGLNVQLEDTTGVLSDKVGVTVGNDYNLSKYINTGLESCISKYILMTEQIGDYLYSQGFTGYFGLDTIFDPETGIIYIIEINARQTANTSFFSRIQQNHKDRFSINDSIQNIFLAEYFAKQEVFDKIDRFDFNMKSNFDNAAVQVIKRNIQNTDVLETKDIFTVDDNGELLWNQGKGRVITPNMEMMRYQSLKSDKDSLYNAVKMLS